MSLSIDLEKNILQNSKIPKWLQATGKNFSGRPPLELDELEEAAREGEIDALDAKATARSRPPYRWKTYKKVKRRLEEMEELHEWIRKKGEQELETGETKIDSFLDGLESTLNQMS